MIPGAMPRQNSGFHIPAMAAHVMQYLQPSGEGLWLDCTTGGGGHARLICQALMPEAVFVGIDRDPAALEYAGECLADARCNVHLVHEHFKNAGTVIDRFGGVVSGALWDLGLSSHQLEAGRGFSFLEEDSPLDMRQDPDVSRTAAEVVNHLEERELADIIFHNSDERFSRRIASSIVRSRPLMRVSDLTQAVLRALPSGYRQRDDVLRRTFQAIRMEVNEELAQIEQSLEAVAARLAPGGRMVVLSYHSGEDRIVKIFFRTGKLEGRLVILTPKPIRPDEDEARTNPRARPARLRAAEALEQAG